MRRILHKAKQSDFLRNNTVYFIGTLTIAMFNYLYYPVLSRLVSVVDFGEIQSTISIFMQLGILLTAFGYVTTNIINNSKKKSEEYGLIASLERRVLAVSLILFVCLVVASVVFQDSFKFQSVVPLVLVGLLIIVNIPSTSRTYILQGQQKFFNVSIAGIIFALGKLILTVGLVYVLTNDVVASILAYIVAQLLNLWYVSHNVGGKYPLSVVFKQPKVDKTKLNRELRYGLVVLVALSLISLLYITDTVVARLFFDPETLGLYSGISSVARIVFFVTASIAGVLIASVKVEDSRIENQKTLSKSLVLVALVGGAVTLLFMLFPDFSVRLLVGGAYVEYAKWLPALSIMMFLASINNLLVSYCLAIRDNRVIVSVIIGVVTLALGLAIFDGSISGLIGSYVVANLMVVVVLLIQLNLSKGSVK